jgi:branched-chain amino acid aminotransferase
MLEYGQKLWKNGIVSDFSEAGKVSVLVHSLHYGVGAFEGIRAYRGEAGRALVFRLREHLERTRVQHASDLRNGAGSSSFRTPCA